MRLQQLRQLNYYFNRGNHICDLTPMHFSFGDSGWHCGGWQSLPQQREHHRCEVNKVTWPKPDCLCPSTPAVSDPPQPVAPAACPACCSGSHCRTPASGAPSSYGTCATAAASRHQTSRQLPPGEQVPHYNISILGEILAVLLIDYYNFNEGKERKQGTGN